MSRKDVENYYNLICNDYHELLTTLNELEEAVKENMVSPERLDNMKVLFEPIKNNYMTWSYLMYLLNKPVKKSKHKRYEGQNKHLVDDKFSPEQALKENGVILNELKNKNF